MCYGCRNCEPKQTNNSSVCEYVVENGNNVEKSLSENHKEGVYGYSCELKSNSNKIFRVNLGKKNYKTGVFSSRFWNINEIFLN